MKEAIIAAINNAQTLEMLYRGDRKAFEKAFFVLYPEIRDNPLAQAWYFRLAKSDNSLSFGEWTDLIVLVALSIAAWIIAKIPAFFGLDEDFFYPRNITFTVLPFLSLWFVIKGRARLGVIWAAAAAFLMSAVYINLLPESKDSQTLYLACLHLALFLWFISGMTYTSNVFRRSSSSLLWLRFNGDLAVMMSVLLIAGGILSGLTIGLFNAAGMTIEKFYVENIAVWGAVAIPLFGSWLLQNNSQLVNKVSPVVARVFTPLVVVMLAVYLTAVPFSGKSPFLDRDFLLVFNVLLLGVLAIIFFALAGRDEHHSSKVQTISLLILALLTLIVNTIALTAIIYRIGEWGITPNRLAVLVSNALIFSNLILLTFRLFNVVRQKALLAEAENSFAFFLPIYAFWTAIVVFAFPLIFNFK